MIAVSSKFYTSASCKSASKSKVSFCLGAWLDLLPDGRFDASPEGMRYLCYTEQGTLNSFTAEELVKEFYDPQAVQATLAKFIE